MGMRRNDEAEATPVQASPAKKEITWTPEKFKDLLANVQQAIKSASQFNNLELDDVELNYVVQEFLELWYKNAMNIQVNGLSATCNAYWA